MMHQTQALERFGIDAEQVLVAVPHSDASTCFVSGSIVEGFGNAESDLDVFLVYDGEASGGGAEYHRDTNTIAFEYLEGVRIDVERWSAANVRGVADRLGACQIDDWDACLNVPVGDLQFAHRILVGWPLREAERFHELQALFDGEHLARLIATRRLAEYHGVAEDASGAIKSQQHGAALLMARRALQLAVDVLVAAHGETNVKDKWRLFKLERIGAPDIVARYWSLETAGIEQRDDVFKYAKQCLSFAQTLVMQVQMEHLSS